jgi:hypothetical protein
MLERDLKACKSCLLLQGLEKIFSDCAKVFSLTLIPAPAPNFFYSDYIAIFKKPLLASKQAKKNTLIFRVNFLIKTSFSLV